MMFKSPVSLQQPIRFLVYALVILCVGWQLLPNRVQSRSQNLAPDISTGALNTAREGHTATLLQNGKVLVAGGRNGGAIFNTAEVYDPVTGQWSPTSNTLTTARHGHNAVLLRSGLVLIIGGQGGNGFVNSAELYDPSDNSWKPALSSQMNLARYHASATLLNNGRVLVAGGMNGGGFLRGAELYDPATRTWTRTDANNNSLGNLTDARAEHTATLLTDGRVLVAGGLNGTAALKSAELYEPSTNRWRRAGDLVTARRLHTATLLPDNTVLVAGGLSGGTVLGSAETYNHATGLWTAAGGFTARRSHTATLLPNGRVLALGGKGVDSNSLNSAEVYNYTSRTWSNALLGPPFPANQVFTLNDARSDHTATMLPNAQVLIVGGLGNATLSSAELYEYAVPAFSVTKNAAGATTQMGATRAAHTATLLPNGKVLVAGGQSMTGTSFVALSSAELYDPNTGAWSATGSLVTERYNHTATLLPNGKVLIVGGNSTGQALDTAELYDPATGFFTSQPTGVARYNHTATLLQNGQVLVVGGINTSGARVTSAQIYNPSAGANGTWSSTANLTPGRSGHTATLLPNGSVLVFGGLTANNAATNTGALFTPSGASGAWTALNFVDSGTTAAPNFRYGHTATLLPTGKVLMSGGRGGVNAANVGLVIGNSEFYNIATRTFERGRAITASRINHTATLLPNGKVLLFGGRTIGASPSNCPEPSANPPVQLFDPFVPLGSVTSVAQIADPVQARNVHAATLLATGEVLISGGFGAEVQPACADPLLRHSELYNAGLGFQESWRPSISFMSATPSFYTVNGAHFQGISEASGHGAQSSASSYPVALLQSLDSEQLLLIPLNPNAGWTNNTFSFNPISGFPAGPALLTIFANGIPSAARVVGGNGGDLNTNASSTGTISGRVLFHNGEGIGANLTLAPTGNSPANCSAARTLTTAPNGDFVFRDLVISPTPTPTPPVNAPVINCGGNRNPQCISTPSPNGCNVAYTAPTVTPAGTPITCSPASGAFFTPGTTTVNCTATNASGSSSCSFAVVYSFMTCPQNIVRSTSGSSVVVTYPAPTISPSNFTATCTPPSGASFPVGVTTVNCVVNQNTGNTCSFTVTVQSVIGFNGKQSAAPVPAHAQGWCGTAQLNTVAASPAQPLSAAPEQSQPGVCRYLVTPSASLNGQPILFFPRTATFNMTSGGNLGLGSGGPNARLAEPAQTGPTCFNCINNVFVSQGPSWNLGAVVQRQGGIAVSDVMLEFSVPYEIFDDRLVCKDGGGNDIPCTNNTKTVAGDVCTKTSANPLITDAEYKCACTAPLNPDGSCSKTVLARYPMASNTGTFTIANVPNGANAVLTPGTITGGAPYTFSYQPVSPPGLSAEMFVRLDRVAQNYANLLIIAQTACTPATAIITPSGATTFCEGGAVMLTANGEAGATYRWFRDGALTAFNTKTITVTQSGMYAVEFTDASGCASTRSANVAVTINPTPAKPAITPSGPTAFCEGGSVNLTAPAGAAAYQWSNGATTQTINVTTSGSYTVRVSSTSDCQSAASDPLTITVNPAPAKPTITPGGPTTFCEGGNVTLSAPASATAYQWSNGATTQTINVTTAGSFTVRVTNASGCQSAVSDAVTVTVNAVPVKPTITANSPTTFCEGGSVTLMATAGAASYQWSNGATTQTINVATAGSFTVRVTNANGCQSAVSDAVTVTANAVPVKPTITANSPTTFCEGGSVTLTATASAASYQWSNGATTQSINVTTAGSYTVRVTNAEGCQSAASDPLAVTVNPAPPKPTIIPSGPTTFCEGGNVTLSAPAGAAAYQWSNGATTQTINVTAAGSFTVRITNASGCLSVASDASAVTVNPPPAKPAITPNGPLAICEGQSVTLSAPAGAAAYSWSNGATTQAVTVTAAGAYTVQITLANNCQSTVSDPVTVTVNPLLSISAQPVSQAVCVGAAASFSVTANGTAPLTYQWRKNGTPINGATLNNYTIPTASLSDAGGYDLVINSGCGTATSNAATLTLNAFSLAANSAAFTATGGTGFVDVAATVSQCSWNATSNTDWLTITSGAAGTGNGRVNFNVAANGGAASRNGVLTIAGLSFNVTQTGTAPAARIDALSQTAALVGSPGFTLTLTGVNFTNTAKVRWNGSERATNFVSATQLTAAITTADLAVTGTFTIDVFDPPPGGGASNQLSFTVQNPVPQLTGLSPANREAGSGQFTLTVNGSGFVNGSVVRWNNNERATAFVSATQLTAVIPATDVAAQGTATVTVFNPAPGGGTSSGATFTINQAPNPVPVLSSLSPSVAAAGGGQFTLTVNGSSFVNGATVRWNNSARATAFVSGTQLTAQIPASDIANPGTAIVTVFNPAPGGGTAGPQSFTITAGAAITSIAPNMVIAGGPAFTLTVNGANLTSGALVRVNGNERPTTLVNSTRVTAEIPASDIAVPGIARITVALLGGSISNETILTVANATAHVSAASFTAGSFAPDSIIACFGTNMATGTEASSTVPLPTTLAGTRMLVRDSAGVAREAPLFFVSPTQINYLLPTGTASGTATVTITASNGALSGGQIEVTQTAPGLFSANTNGRGVPAAFLIRVTSGNQRTEQIARFDSATNSYVPIPIDLGPAGDEVYLILFGTGIRYRAGLNSVTCTLGGTAVEVGFAGAQGDLVGLDQINLGPLPRALLGRGLVNLTLRVEGREANALNVVVQ